MRDAAFQKRNGKSSKYSKSNTLCVWDSIIAVVVILGVCLRLFFLFSFFKDKKQRKKKQQLFNKTFKDWETERRRGSAQNWGRAQGRFPAPGMNFLEDGGRGEEADERSSSHCTCLC